VLPRFQVSGLPAPAETLRVRSAPNVFTAASTQAPAPAPLDSTDPAATAASWWSGDPRIAVVNQRGMVVGRAPGTTLVKASLGTHSSYTAVQVVPPGDTSVRIIAHRGFMRRFPENTLPAVKGAFDNGADAVEVDIRLTTDGVPVVMHDETVDRTTDGHGAVSAHTAAELATLNACAHWVGYQPCAIPLMSDVLREAHGHGGVLLHLYGTFTSNDLRSMLAAVHAAGMDRDALFISFDYPVLLSLRALDPVVALGFLTMHPPDPKLIDALGRMAPIVELQSAIADSTRTREYVLESSRQQREVGVWVVWNQAQARQAVALGFRTLIADVPIDRAALFP
jgi:glycerophosphoryl diester phosphodiesterase